MTAQQGATRAVGKSDAWSWPIDRSRYDRTPALGAAEYAALAERVRRSDAGHALSPARLCPALERLVRPLSAALDLTRALPSVRREVTNLFLREMYHRESAFWGWSRADWIDLFNDQRPQRLAHRLRHYRHQVYVIGYVLCDVDIFSTVDTVVRYPIAVKVFGQEAVDAAIDRVRGVLLGWGYSARRCDHYLARLICAILLANRSPRLDDLTTARLSAMAAAGSPSLEDDYALVSRVLVHLGILEQALPSTATHEARAQTLQNVSPVWAGWCQRWRDTSTVAPSTRSSIYYYALTAGRWLAEEHPEIDHPEQWTRDLALAYVTAVDRMTVGRWAMHPMPAAVVGKPLAPRVKVHHLSSIRGFFRDLQEWAWITRRFDPGRCFTVPRVVRALVGPNPRIIADDIWAKLLWAGLTLSADDIHASAAQCARAPSTPREHRYPLEMVHAVVLVWLFAGLRSDELRRLRVGCIRWQQAPDRADGAAPQSSPAGIALLDVPTHKTGTAFTKPVDRAVGEAIEGWERVRPHQPALVDSKTGDVVHFLFAYRGYHLGDVYLNRTAIPLLCRKAGVPLADARGPITSHRARSTIASQLANAKEPMTLLELQAWLGHRSPASTRHYVSVSPTKLAQSYRDAGYFGRAMRTIAVLIDRDAVMSGAAGAGEPWRFYDLGHGYCTYDFFDQCPHRMACAKCAFYRPKGSTQAQMLEGKANLVRMLQEMPLTEEERAAVDDGVVAYEALLAHLADIPTPAGPTPRQLVGTPLPVFQPTRE